VQISTTYRFLFVSTFVSTIPSVGFLMGLSVGLYVSCVLSKIMGHLQREYCGADVPTNLLAEVNTCNQVLSKYYGYRLKFCHSIASNFSYALEMILPSIVLYVRSVTISIVKLWD
jgi:hypothetical protein